MKAPIDRFTVHNSTCGGKGTKGQASAGKSDLWSFSGLCDWTMPCLPQSECYDTPRYRHCDVGYCGISYDMQQDASLAIIGGSNDNTRFGFSPLGYFDLLHYKYTLLAPSRALLKLTFSFPLWLYSNWPPKPRPFRSSSFVSPLSFKTLPS